MQREIVKMMQELLKTFNSGQNTVFCFVVSSNRVQIDQKFCILKFQKLNPRTIYFKHKLNNLSKNLYSLPTLIGLPETTFYNNLKCTIID